VINQGLNFFVSFDYRALITALSGYIAVSDLSDGGVYMPFVPIVVNLWSSPLFP